MKIVHRKSEIHLRAFPEEGDDLPGNQLEQGEEKDGQPQAAPGSQEICPLHPKVFFGAIIKTDDGLQPLGDADDERHVELVDFRDNPHACDRHGFPVGGKGTVVFQGFGHDDLHCHHGQLVGAGCRTQGHDPFHVLAVECQMLLHQGDALAVGQEPESHAAGYHLADDGGQGGSCHAPIQAKDEQGIQNGIDDGSGEIAQHGKLGPSVCPDEMAAPGGDDEEGKAK